MSAVAWVRWAATRVGYWLRPYDMLADSRRWCWQPRQRCAVIVPQGCQGADFSKLLAHLDANLREHAERDGLSPVRTAVFLARGGHAPGEHCPSEGPPPPAHASYCSWLLGDDCDCGAERTNPTTEPRKEHHA